MKKIYLQFSLASIILLTFSYCWGEITTSSAKELGSTTPKEFPRRPKIKSDEYAIYSVEDYKVFKTRRFENIELNEGCFKENKPHCQAYEFAQIKPATLEIKTPGVNNFSAIHCEKVGGQNLLAIDSKNNQYNFCQFDDGSMVNSWSMTRKHFPRDY